MKEGDLRDGIQTPLDQTSKEVNVSPDVTEHSGKARRLLVHNYNQTLDLENEQQSEIATLT